MSKGKLIGIAGRIQTRSYEAKDGGRRYVTEVVAEEIQFLEWGAKNSPNEGGFNGNSDAGYGSSSFEDMTPIDDGDIPF